MTTQALHQEWLNGDAVSVGRTLMDPLSAPEQVARCVAVLELCRSRCSAVREVDRAVTVGRDNSRWHEGHDVFDDIRRLTLIELDRGSSRVGRLLRGVGVRRTPSRLELLYVAEIVAKTIYNASGEPAPFDADSPWWLAPNARDFVRALDDELFREEMWLALCGGRAEPAG